MSGPSQKNPYQKKLRYLTSLNRDDDAEVQAGKRQKLSQMERKIESKYLTHWKLIIKFFLERSEGVKEKSFVERTGAEAVSSSNVEMAR